MGILEDAVPQSVKEKMDCIAEMFKVIFEAINDGGKRFKAERVGTFVKDDVVDEIVINWFDKEDNWKYLRWGMDSQGRPGQVTSTKEDTI